MGQVLAGLAKVVPAIGKGVAKAAPYLSGASAFGNPIANAALQAGRGALGGLLNREVQQPQAGSAANLQAPSGAIIPDLTLQDRLRVLGLPDLFEDPELAKRARTKFGSGPRPTQFGRQ